MAQQIALIKLFLQTDPSVLPAGLVLSTLARVAALGFFAVLVVMFAVRRVPQRTAPGFYPRCAAVVGTFLGVSFLTAAAARTFVCALPSLAYLDYQWLCFRDVGGAGTRALDQHPAGGATTCDVGALWLRPPSALSWRDRCHDWRCAAISVGMGAVAAGPAIGNPTSAHEIRGTGAI